jgi:hypothetical protein
MGDYIVENTSAVTEEMTAKHLKTEDSPVARRSLPKPAQRVSHQNQDVW